jgi:hypothetical protein
MEPDGSESDIWANRRAHATMPIRPAWPDDPSGLKLDICENGVTHVTWTHVGADKAALRERSLCPFASPGFCDTSVESMKQVVVVFHLREGSEPEAAKLAGTDPPFDPAEAGFARVAIFVTPREAIFVLEGDEPLWSQDELMNDFLRPALRARLDEWRKLADVQTWPAEPVFVWEASADQ